jgi:HSP20 family protein
MKRNSGLGLPSLWEDMWDSNFLDFPSFFRTGRSLPAANIEEHDEDYLIEVAAPGMKKKDFDIKVEGNQLVISSTREEKNEDKDKNGNFRRREFSYESFSRSFTLPDSVDEDNIKAKYDDGILKVTLPKREDAKTRDSKVIEIS